jgi:hypothetical protein
VRERIAFVSTNPGWGGSEELWAGAAERLARQGASISASISDYKHHRIRQLMRASVAIQFRKNSLSTRVSSRLRFKRTTALDLELTRFVAANRPHLIVVSSDFDFPFGFLEEADAKRIPFATICQANSEYFWPDDERAEHYRRLFAKARRCYFVSLGNKKLFERQIGCELKNSEIVWNPFNVPVDAAPPLACARRQWRITVRIGSATASALKGARHSVRSIR